MIICLADRYIDVRSLHPQTIELCQPYAVDDPPTCDFCVEIAQEDIDFERKKSARENELEGIPVRNHSDAYLETLAVYRKIAERMPSYDTVLFHGSAIAVDGEGYIFTAKSGTGKSTHSRLWREMLGDRAMMINDDKPLLRLADSGLLVYGTPWDGKHRLSTNTSVPVRAICILERSDTNRIERVEFNDAYPLLLQQTYRPQDAGALMKTLEIIDGLSSVVELWRLGANMQPDAPRVSYEAMSGRLR